MVVDKNHAQDLWMLWKDFISTRFC